MTIDFTAYLDDRCVIHVDGEDALPFLQNIVTNDMLSIAPGTLRFSCLLTPQGQYLHDFFVFAGREGLMLDCEAARVDDLLRRFTIFRLRSKVTFTQMPGLRVYASTTPVPGYIDPRREGLGYRIYASDVLPASPVQVYDDFCIAHGVPCGTRTIRPEKETMADVSLDLLNAVSWEKGCFIGQEVAARMHNRGLTKRRLFVVTGRNLQPGPLKQGEVDAGEIRQVNSTGDMALAVIKIAAASKKDAELVTADGAAVRLAESNI